MSEKTTKQGLINHVKQDDIKLYEGEKFYYVSIMYCCHCTDDGIKVFDAKYKGNEQIKSLGGNCFQNEEDAISVCNKIRELFHLKLYKSNHVKSISNYSEED